MIITISKNIKNKDLIKKYNSRDEFINDDNLSDEEKAEIMQAILEAEEEQMEKWYEKKNKT